MDDGLEVKIRLLSKLAEIPTRATSGAAGFDVFAVDYAEIPSLTKSGYIGVKVWIAKGEKVA